jgi:hypothetical protein
MLRKLPFTCITGPRAILRRLVEPIGIGRHSGLLSRMALPEAEEDTDGLVGDQGVPIAFHDPVCFSSFASGSHVLQL